MKTEVFEKAILEQGLEPVEVKLKRNQVTWFISRDKKTRELVVFDKTGMAFILEKFDWHGQNLNIQYKGKNVMVNDRQATKCPLFRLWD